MLKVDNLSINFIMEENIVKAVDSVSFLVQQNEILGLVGESGSGKSTIAHSILKLLPKSAQITSGEILFDGEDILKTSESRMQKIRGAKISMIFQDPFSSLNPVLTIGDQIIEAIILHQGLNKKDARNKAIEMLDVVQIKDSTTRINDYPHQFSGGQRQRVMIAMAIACQPKLLIADEPTTALDATTQAEILRLLKEIRQKFNISIIFITHNFNVVKYMCERVVVLKKGQVVEEGRTHDVFENPKDPYTQKLIACLKELKSRND